MKPRPKPQGLHAEPIYPGHKTVVVSFRDPDWCVHAPEPECKTQYPHLISECGLFE